MNALTIDKDGWTAAGEAQLPDAVALRRAIHAEPELGLHLPKTTEKVLKDELKKRGIKARVVRVPNHADGLKRLVSKNTEAHAGDQATLFGIGFLSKGEQRLVITEDMLSFEPLALPLPRNDADFRLVVNTSLSNLYQRGDVGRSWERHFGVHGVKPTQLLLMLYRLNSFSD